MLEDYLSFTRVSLAGRRHAEHYTPLGRAEFRTGITTIRDIVALRGLKARSVVTPPVSSPPGSGREGREGSAEATALWNRDKGFHGRRFSITTQGLMPDTVPSGPTGRGRPLMAPAVYRSIIPNGILALQDKLPEREIANGLFFFSVPQDASAGQSPAHRIFCDDGSR